MGFWFRRIDRVFKLFEGLLDPFEPQPDYEPPARLIPYVWYYVRQAKWAFLAMLIFGFVSALVEALMFSYVGQLVDLTSRAPDDDRSAQLSAISDCQRLVFGTGSGGHVSHPVPARNPYDGPDFLRDDAPDRLNDGTDRRRFFAVRRLEVERRFCG